LIPKNNANKPLKAHKKELSTYYPLLEVKTIQIKLNIEKNFDKDLEVKKYDCMSD
jgi:hypothetical protein